MTEDATSGPKKIGQYVILRKLGQGAMGVVWLGYDAGLQRNLAIKVLPGVVSQDKKSLARFVREAQSAARLNHPNVVTVYQIGRDGDRVFIAMEVIAGGSLKDELGNRGRMGWRQATRAIRDACSGLAVAHEAGLVHRDIKPANLLRTRRGVIKVADFGVARSKAAATRLTRSGIALGTPAYMAPEQCRGTGVDARSDLYSLTCTYYALLCGHGPFSRPEESPEPAVVLYRHVHEEVPDPRAFAPDLPDEICQIIARGCQKEPAQRYQSAEEMKADLEAVLSAQEQQFTYATPWERLVQVRKTSPGGIQLSGLPWSLSTIAATRIRKYARKQPVALAVAAAVVVAALIGVIALWWLNAGRSAPSQRPEAPANEIAVEPLPSVAPAGELPLAEIEVLQALIRRQQAGAWEAECLSNLQLLGHALLMYRFDNRGFPPGSSWCDALEGYLGGSKKVFQCPELAEERCGYGFNENLAGRIHIQQYAITVLLFETDGGWNVSGGPERMAHEPRHPRGYNILFADAHVKAVPKEELDELVWVP